MSDGHGEERKELSCHQTEKQWHFREVRREARRGKLRKRRREGVREARWEEGGRKRRKGKEKEAEVGSTRKLSS